MTRTLHFEDMTMNDIGKMTLAECGRLLCELVPDKYVSVSVRIDYHPPRSREPKVYVSLWDGESHYEGPTVEAAYELLRLAHLPPETNPAAADAIVADLRAELVSI